MGSAQSRAVNRQATEEPHGIEPDYVEPFLTLSTPPPVLRKVYYPLHDNAPVSPTIARSIERQGSAPRPTDAASHDADMLPDFEDEEEIGTSQRQAQQQVIVLEERLADAQTAQLGTQARLEMTERLLDRSELASLEVQLENDWLKTKLRAVMRDLEHADRMRAEAGTFSVGSPRGLPVDSDLYRVPRSPHSGYTIYPIPPRWARPTSSGGHSAPEHEPTRHTAERRRAVTSERGTPPLDPRARVGWNAGHEPDALQHHQSDFASQDPQAPATDGIPFTQGRKRSSTSTQQRSSKRQHVAFTGTTPSRTFRRRPNAAELNNAAALSSSSSSSPPRMFQHRPSPAQYGSKATRSNTPSSSPARSRESLSASRPLARSSHNSTSTASPTRTGTTPGPSFTREVRRRTSRPLTRSRAATEGIVLPDLFNNRNSI